MPARQRFIIMAIPCARNSSLSVSALLISFREKSRPMSCALIVTTSGSSQKVGSNVLHRAKLITDSDMAESIYSALAEDFQKHIYRTPSRFHTTHVFSPSLAHILLLQILSPRSSMPGGWSTNCSSLLQQLGCGTVRRRELCGGVTCCCRAHSG